MYKQDFFGNLNQAIDCKKISYEKNIKTTKMAIKNAKFK